MKIPEEMAVVGFSNDYGSALIEPGLTTIAQPIHEIGEAGIELLLDQLSKDISEWKPVTRVLKTELIVRGSSYNGVLPGTGRSDRKEV
jgi:LacI family repressor for deo operon, udp, cdd, tsx, nupC, and nupG